MFPPIKSVFPVSGISLRGGAQIIGRGWRPEGVGAIFSKGPPLLVKVRGEAGPNLAMDSYL